MGWSIDIHKYPSETTREILQILRDHQVNRDSSDSVIANAEAEMNSRGLYSGAMGANGRIRRALFTYFSAYNCMDENGNITPFGQLFADGRISLKEFAFHYIANYSVSQGGSYYPLHLILLFIKKVSLVRPREAFLTATDFKTLQEFNSIHDLDDSFLTQHLSGNRFAVSRTEFRQINFDGWKKLLLLSGLFSEDGEKLKLSASQFILEWLLYAYSQNPLTRKGSVCTGVFSHVPFHGYDMIVGLSLQERNNSFLNPQPWNLSDIGSCSKEDEPDSLPLVQKLLEDKTLSRFALKVMIECYKEDKLNSLIIRGTKSTFTVMSVGYQCINFASEPMSRVFLLDNEQTVTFLNAQESVTRWHDHPFLINNETAFLTTQWYDIDDVSSSTKSTFDKLSRLIAQSYPGVFELKRIVRADHTKIYQLLRLNGKQVELEIPKEMKNYITALKTKPFLLLAGISGTGKSQKVKELAYMTCPDTNGLRDDNSSPGNYCLIEVKPNWHDSSELLGYYSNLSGKYELTPFIRFIVKAWQNPNIPFFVCLDEMNLAPVEQYFAEFLSTLETRSIDSDGKVRTASMLDATQFCSYRLNDDDGKELYPPSDKDVIEFIRKNGLRLPENLFVIGTVNMDDTTHQFSRKVIDRAFTIEMNGDSLSSMFDEENVKALEWHDPLVPFEKFKPEFVKAADVLKDERFKDYVDDIKNQVPNILDDFNAILKNTPFRVSFRVQNEFILYLSSIILESDCQIKPDTAIQTTALIILLEKILPRIQGDNKLLKTEKSGKSSNVLKDLKEYVEDSFTSLSTLDMYQEVISKLDEMNSRLEIAYFANFF